MNGPLTLAAATRHAGPNRDGWIVIVLLVLALGAALALTMWSRRRRGGQR